MEKSIAVLVPCYNEAIAIGKVVADFKAALPTATIYVYDNNSTDDTFEVARQYGAVVRREMLQGKGNVIRRMFADIDADIYLRNTKRCINNEIISTIDLANININDDFQNKGYCSKIIQYLIEIAKSKNIQAIYIECVLSDAIEHIIINKFDFIKIKYNDEFQKNYYMYVK